MPDHAEFNVEADQAIRSPTTRELFQRVLAAAEALRQHGAPAAFVRDDILRSRGIDPLVFNVIVAKVLLGDVLRDAYQAATPPNTPLLPEDPALEALIIEYADRLEAIGLTRAKFGNSS